MFQINSRNISIYKRDDDLLLLNQVAEMMMMIYCQSLLTADTHSFIISKMIWVPENCEVHLNIEVI